MLPRESKIVSILPVLGNLWTHRGDAQLTTDIVARHSMDSPPPPIPLRIGEVRIDPPLLLAPMAGVTDLPYRRLMASFGAAMVTSEMISAEGLLREHPGSWRLARRDPAIPAVQAVQLFGHDPQRIAEAAQRLEDQGVQLIDINAGCPVKKVARQGAGAGLLRNPDLLAEMIQTVRRRTCVPLTAKIRLGWDRGSLNVIEVSRKIAQAGADAITVHARTAVQLYQGQAQWEWIREVKSRVNIPVIGNGDVTGPRAARRMLAETGCDAIMIGRASLGNPWIFQAIAQDWGYRSQMPSPPDWSHFLDVVKHHLDDFCRERPVPSGHYRKLLVWYSKGCPNATRLRAELMTIKDPATMLEHFSQWVRQQEHRERSFAANRPTLYGIESGEMEAK